MKGVWAILFMQRRNTEGTAGDVDSLQLSRKHTARFFKAKANGPQNQSFERREWQQELSGW